MSSSVTSSSVLASGVDVLVPYLAGGSSTSIMSSTLTSATSNVKHRNTLSSPGMSGLLSSKSLIQATEDEKLVVATLATLDSGSASTLIKQDLKWIIQSRRKAEGKEEIKVEFKKPIKDELTSEEVVKRLRRRELNRLAARRSRERGQKRKDKLVEEIKFLQSQNSKLANDLTFLTDERDNIINSLRQHMTQCSDYAATRNAAAGLPRRILDMLGFLNEPSSSSSSHLSEDKTTPSSLAISNLHIDITPSESSSISMPQSPHPYHSSTSTLQNLSYSSCPPSPVILGLTGTSLFGSQGSSSPSIISSPFHLTMSPSPSQTGQSLTSMEDVSRLSQDSTPPFSPPSNSPRKAHSTHQSPRHETSPSSKKYLAHSEGKEEFTRPASPISVHPSRFLLERSFSCPSSSNKEHFHNEIPSSPQSVFKSKEPSPVQDDSLSYSSELGSSRSRELRNVSNEQEAPLDLVVRSNSYQETESSQISYCSPYSTDTWPRRSNTRPGLIRGAGRRWSVDDQHSAHLREPLNLSTKPDTSHRRSPSQPS